jgi:acetoin:2,6-dichlorophenolindophenol oxidoreductase subunit beta
MRTIKYVDALREALREEMSRDEKVFLMGESIGGKQDGIYKVTMGLEREFGKERVMETPLSETAIAGAAVGAALFGRRPVAEIMFSNLLPLCADEIHNQAAKFHYISGGKARVPLVIRTSTWMRMLTGPHHCGVIDSWLMNTPGLKVVAPSTPKDAKGLLKSSIRDDDPVLFIEHAHLYNIEGEVPQEQYLSPLGKASIKKTGNDVSIITYGILVSESLKAAEILKEEGIDAEIIDLMTLNPLDKETIIDSVKKTSRAVIAYEGPKTAGPGAEISAILAEEALDYLDSPIIRVASFDAPQPANKVLVRPLTVGIDDICSGARKALHLI